MPTDDISGRRIKGKVRTQPRSRRVRPFPLPESPADHWSKVIRLLGVPSVFGPDTPTVVTRVPASEFTGIRSPGQKRNKPLVKKAGRQKRLGPTE